MKIYFGSDHGGFELKQELVTWLIQLGHVVVDLGPSKYIPDDDYPLMAFKVGKQVVADQYSIGILVCRSGGGMCIASNKVDGVRAVDVYDTRSAKHARSNNDANLITLSADWLPLSLAKGVVTAFLTSKFLVEKRHIRRIEQINKFEKGELE